MKNFITDFFKKWVSVSGFLVILVVWSLLSRSFNSFILPSPLEVLNAFFAIFISGELLKNFLITLERTLIGFSLAFLIGIGVAFLMNKSSILRRILQPLVTFIQTTPPVVWLILAFIWFGIARTLTPVFIVVMVVFPIILINFFEGLESFNIELIQMAKVFGSKKSRLFLHILLPGLSPHLVSSTRIGLAFAWKSTVFAEFLASASGIGFMLSTANSLLNTSAVFAWTLVLVLAMLGMEYLLINPAKRKANLWIAEAKS